MFHHHVFEDVHTDYIAPVDVENVKGYGAELMRFISKLSAGYTVIQQRCECGKYRTEEVIGRLSNAG